MQSDVNTVSFADETGHLIYSGSDDNLCKVNCLFLLLSFGKLRWVSQRFIFVFSAIPRHKFLRPFSVVQRGQILSVRLQDRIHGECIISHLDWAINFCCR